MSTLAYRLVSHARNAVLFPRPGLALLAVSGGEDSVALLDLLAATGGDLGLQLAVAHVDHGIAPESATVAGTVMELAARYGVPAEMKALHLGPGASETVARAERYRVLRELQRRLGAEYLVTAHHADDQIETVLFRFLRGSAPAGLAGIASRGPGGLVRPLLPFRRSDLHEWLQTRYLDPVTRPAVYQDPANRSPRHHRSWLRHELLPIVRERLGPQADENLLLGQTHAQRERDAWSALLRQLPDLDFQLTEWGAGVARAPLRTYDKALSEALLRAVAREAGCLLGPARAARLVDFSRSATSGRTLELGEGWLGELVFDRLLIERRSPAESSDACEWGAEESGRVHWADWEISWRPEPAGETTREGLTTWVPLGPGVIRSAAGGDRVYPLGGVGHRSVRRLLMEARVPRNERTDYPVVVRADQLLWVPGVCRAAAAVPAPGALAMRLDAHRA